MQQVWKEQLTVTGEQNFANWGWLLKDKHSKVRPCLTIPVIHFLNKYITLTFQNCFDPFPSPTKHHFLFSQWFLHCVWQQPCFHHLETQYSEQNLSSWLMCHRVCIPSAIESEKLYWLNVCFCCYFKKTHSRWKVPLNELSVRLCLQRPVSRRHTSKPDLRATKRKLSDILWNQSLAPV